MCRVGLWSGRQTCSGHPRYVSTPVEHRTCKVCDTGVEDEYCIALL